MTQPPRHPGQSDPEPDPDSTRIRPSGSPRPGSDQPATPQPGQQPPQCQPPQPPQWQPPQPAPYPSGQQPTHPVTAARPPDPGNGRGRALLFAGVGVVVLGLLASAVALFLLTGDGGAEVADLGRGDCVESSAIADGSSDVSTIEVVSCAGAHDAEVVAISSLADSDDSEDASDACLQTITDEGTSVAALAVDGHEVRPLSADGRVACLVVGDDLEGSVLP